MKPIIVAILAVAVCGCVSQSVGPDGVHQKVGPFEQSVGPDGVQQKAGLYEQSVGADGVEQGKR